MKRWLIMRHAKSSWDHAGVGDHERPLNPRGLRDAPAMGRRLADDGLLPDLICCSTARRAVETARAVAGACGHSRTIEEVGALYLAPPDPYVDLARQIPDSVDVLLTIGHNPGLEDLVLEVTGKCIRMPTGAVAIVEWDIEHWTDINLPAASGLTRFLTPEH